MGTVCGFGFSFSWVLWVVVVNFWFLGSCGCVLLWWWVSVTRCCDVWLEFDLLPVTLCFSCLEFGGVVRGLFSW